MRRTVSGEIAFSSTSNGRDDPPAEADPTASATWVACSGGTTDSTMSASLTTAARSGTSSMPARTASRDVRSLRPESVATTRAPPTESAWASALPIAPGLTMPTVGTSRVYDCSDEPGVRVPQVRVPRSLVAR